MSNATDTEAEAGFQAHDLADYKPRFGPNFRDELERLFKWRRDVRSFRRDPLPEGFLEELIGTAVLSPSVGNSQPWRFVQVESPERRAAVTAEFERANAEALNLQDESRRALYARLKLSGLKEAPVQLAVYCDEETRTGFGLGQSTMPETRRYSVVMAIYTLWLFARAHGVGMGWVSILEPETINRILDVQEDWRLVAYLCIGYPQDESEVPELVRLGWQDREKAAGEVVRR